MMIRKNKGIPIVLAGLLISLLSLLLSGATAGAGFLFTITALLGVAVMIFGVTYLPEDKTALRKAAKILRYTIITGFCVWLVSFVIVEILIFQNSKADPYEGEKYVLVLGAGVNGETPSLALSSRLETALPFLEAHPDTVAVLCGSMGPGERITEAECMRRWLTERGIPERRLILEDQSHNTIANVSNAFAILEEQDGAVPTSVMIVSNEFHVWRAKMIAARFGVKAGSVPAPTPSAGLTNYSFFLREYFSLFFFLFK